MSDKILKQEKRRIGRRARAIELSGLTGSPLKGHLNPDSSLENWLREVHRLNVTLNRMKKKQQKEPLEHKDAGIIIPKSIKVKAKKLKLSEQKKITWDALLKVLRLHRINVSDLIAINKNSPINKMNNLLRIIKNGLILPMNLVRKEYLLRIVSQLAKELDLLELAYPKFSKKQLYEEYLEYIQISIERTKLKMQSNIIQFHKRLKLANQRELAARIQNKRLKAFRTGSLKAFNELIQIGSKFTLNDIDLYIRNVKEGSKTFLKIKLSTSSSEKEIPVNDTNIEDVLKILNLRYESIDDEISYGSDYFKDIKFSRITSNIAHNRSIMSTNGNTLSKSGAYFNKYNLTSLDLSRYQVFNKDQIKNNAEQCIIHVLKCSDKFSLAEINKIKLGCVGKSFLKKELKKICLELNFSITLSLWDNKRKQNALSYINFDNSKPKKSKGRFDIKMCLFNGHYFINENMPWTVNFLNNIDQYEGDETDFDRTNGNKDKMALDKSFKRANSMQTIVILSNKGDKYFKHITNVPDKGITQKINNDVYLGNLSKEQKPHKWEKKQEEKEIVLNLEPFNPKKNYNKARLVEYCRELDYPTTGTKKILHDYLTGTVIPKQNKVTKTGKKIFFADFESDVVSYEEHVPILVAVADEVSEPRYYRSSSPEVVVTHLLNHLVKNTPKDKDIVVYFHNLKYDYSLMKPTLIFTSIIEQDGNIYGFKAIYRGRTIEFRDSYKMINTKLADFPKIFGLPKIKKGAAGYTYHTFRNIMNDEEIDVKDYLTHVKDEHKNEFDGMKRFSPTRMYIKYCLNDVKVLRAGLLAMDEIVKKDLNKDMSVFNFLTISSLSFEYFKAEKSMDGIHMMSGNARKFISLANYGGKTMGNDIYKKKLLNFDISCQDANSLYPSAIKRICDEGGFATGEYVQIDKIVPELDDYVVEILVTKINRPMKPAMVCSRLSGQNIYYETIPEGVEGITTVVGKTALEDWINFCEIEFEFIKGIGTKEHTFNTKFGEAVKKVYDVRLKAKADNNTGLSSICKLILNSTYGKTQTRLSNIETCILNNKKWDKEKKEYVEDTKYNDYLVNNFHTIKQCDSLNDDQHTVTKFKFDSSYNFIQMSVKILDMSKRIMNELFNTMRNLKVDYIYTDTDSVYLETQHLDKVVSSYNTEYNREMIGKYLLQFSNDLEVNGKDAVSKESLFLGKKSYLCKLETEDCEKGMKVTMKGIPKTSLLNCCKEKYKNNMLDLYKDLANENKVQVVINFSSFNPSFDFNEHGVLTRDVGSFKRTLHFK